MAPSVENVSLTAPLQDFIIRHPQCFLVLTRKVRPKTEVTLSKETTVVRERTYLADILVLDPTYLLNIRSAL